MEIFKIVGEQQLLGTPLSETLISPLVKLILANRDRSFPHRISWEAKYLENFDYTLQIDPDFVALLNSDAWWTKDPMGSNMDSNEVHHATLLDSTLICLQARLLVTLPVSVINEWKWTLNRLKSTSSDIALKRYQFGQQYFDERLQAVNAALNTSFQQPAVNSVEDVDRMLAELHNRSVRCLAGSIRGSLD